MKAHRTTAPLVCAEKKRNTVSQKHGGKNGTVNLWLCLALLILGNVHDVHAVAAPTKIAFGFAAMNARVTPLWAAKEEGFFAKNDIDGEPIFVRGAPTLNAALLSGDLQAGYTGGTAVMGAAVGGADFKILAVLTNKVTYDLVARRGIKSVEELRGKQIGVTSIGGTNWMGTILGLERLGLDPTRDKINFISRRRRLRSYSRNFGRRPRSDRGRRGVQPDTPGKGLTCFGGISPLKIPITSASLVFPNAFIQKNPRIVESLLKAILEGIIWGISPLNKSKAINLISKRLRITPQEAEEGYKDMLLGLDANPSLP